MGSGSANLRVQCLIKNSCITLQPAGQFEWTGTLSSLIRKVCAPWKSYFEFWMFLSSNTCLVVVIDVSER